MKPGGDDYKPDFDWIPFDKRFTGNGKGRSLSEGTLSVPPELLTIPAEPPPPEAKPQPIQPAPLKLIQKRKRHYKRHDTWCDWKGRTQTLRQWATELGISLSTLQQRWYRGDREDDLMRPAKKRTPAPDQCGTAHQYRRRTCRCDLCKAEHARIAREYRKTVSGRKSNGK